MAHFIIADNQELTAFALATLVTEQSHTFSHATDKQELIARLQADAESIVVLDFTLFDFDGDDSLLVTAERFPRAMWIIVSDDLTPALMRKLVYLSHSFSLLFKDSSLKSFRSAVASA